MIFRYVVDFSTIGNTIDEWSQEIDNAALEALTAQAVVQRAGLNVARVNALLVESQTAAGEVRQLQLLNQNIAVLSQQMNDVLQLLAADGRLAAIQVAEREKKREAIRAMKSGMMKNFGKGAENSRPLTRLP